MARTVGYLRVSTVDQDIDKNKAEILTFCNDRNFGHVEWVPETVSGVVSWRKRAIHSVIMNLDKGDRVVTSELSRLGRSTLEVLEILKAAKDKTIEVYSVKEGFELNSSIQAKIMATMLSLFSELERYFISQRTKQALQVKKKAGVRLGRPPGPGKSRLDPNRQEVIALLKNGAPKTFVAKRYGVSTPNLYNWLRKNNVSLD